MNKVCQNTSCKFPSTHKLMKCSDCTKNFCSEKCVTNHRCQSEDTSNISQPLYYKRSNTVSSKFIKPGKILKEMNDDPLFLFSNFEIVKIGKNNQIIGSGLYGDIYLARNKMNNKLYAIKQMNTTNIKENNVNEELIENEINIHSKFIHDNIIRLYSYHVTSEAYYLIMHYSPNGTLNDILKRNKFLDEKTAFKYFIQIVSAVNFLHENNYIHRDIKPENCLIDENNVIKLCDFGCCCEVSLSNRISFCGTQEYMTAEDINDMPYNHAVDIWSLGVLLYEMLQGVSLFKPKNGRNISEEYNEILQKINKNTLKFDKSVSKSCEDLIRKMLSVDKNSRLRIKEIINHPWVIGFEREINEDIRVYKNMDNISTNHNSSTSANSIKEYNKFTKRERDEKIHKYTNCNKIDETELRSFCLLENNDSIFDRVLGKVNEKNKYKSSKKKEKTKDLTIDNGKKTEDETSHNLNQFLSPTNTRKECYFDNAIYNTNCSLLDEIKNDIEIFNNIVNPKALNTYHENKEKTQSNPSSQKNLTFINKDLMNNEFPLMSNNPIQENDENFSTNKKTNEYQCLKKIEITPESEFKSPKKKNCVEEKKNFMAAIDILEKAHTKTNIIQEKKEDENGFWSFLNPFKCGKCD